MLWEISKFEFLNRKAIGRTTIIGDNLDGRIAVSKPKGLGLSKLAIE
jgi:hypothetical protein